MCTDYEVGCVIIACISLHGTVCYIYNYTCCKCKWVVVAMD